MAAIDRSDAQCSRCMIGNYRTNPQSSGVWCKLCFLLLSYSFFCSLVQFGEQAPINWAPDHAYEPLWCTLSLNLYPLLPTGPTDGNWVRPRVYLKTSSRELYYSKSSCCCCMYVRKYNWKTKNEAFVAGRWWWIEWRERMWWLLRYQASVSRGFVAENVVR